MANVIEIIIAVKNLTGKPFSAINRSIMAVGQAVRNLAITLSPALLALKAFADFESAFSGVRKTVEATAEEFQVLSDGIRDMAKEIPASASAIAGVAEAAGQLGIQKAAILDFTRTMVDLGNATNLSANQAATSLARLANITQLQQDQFDELGSAIVELGNNFATTEAEIVQLSLRIAGAGKVIGLTEAEILGFATALSSVGIRAELGGTAISRVFSDIANSVAAGGETLQGFADIAGQTMDEFRKNFETDAAGAVVQFIEGIDRINKSGGNVFKVLEDVGFANIRVRDTLLRAAGAGDLLNDAIETANRGWMENTALTEEAAKRYETLSSKFKIALNRVKDLGITIGAELAPAFTKMLEVVGRTAVIISETFKSIPEIAGLAFSTLQDILVNRIDVIGRLLVQLGISMAEIFFNVFVELGAVVLKLGATLFTPLAVAFDVLGQNIKFAWQIIVNNLAETMVRAATFIAKKLNVLLPEAFEFDISGLENILEVIKTEVIEIPQTFEEAWKETAKEVGVVFGSIGENFERIGEVFQLVIKDVKDEFGELADLPEMQAFLKRLDEIFTEASEKAGTLGETLKKEIGDAIAPKDELAAAKETWELWFGDWLSAGQGVLESFQEISKNTFDNFKQGVGDAFVSAIVFGEDLGATLANVMRNIAGSVISALIQIGIQRVAQSLLASVLNVKEASSRLAVLHAETFAGAFASTVAIPIVGPALAPGVAAASLAAVSAGSIAAAAVGAGVGAGIAGAAGAGLDNIPENSTFFLHRGERVVAPRQNKDLTAFLKNGRGGGNITIREVNFFPGARLDETLLNMPPETFRKFGRKMLAQLNELGDEGETTTLRRRATNI